MLTRDLIAVANLLVYSLLSNELYITRVKFTHAVNLPLR